MAKTEPLSKILNQQTIYVIPDYQRDYSWKESEILTLLDDIFQLLEPDSEPHFIGAFVTVDYNPNESKGQAVNLKEKWPNLTDDDICNVVDGQQRLTTLLVFIKAIIILVNEDKDLTQPKQLMYFSNFRRFTEAGPANEEGQISTSLVLNKPTGIYFNNILTGLDDKCDKTKAGYKRLRVCLETCLDYLRMKRDEWKNDKPYVGVDNFYGELFKALSNKVLLVKIECDKSSNAFQVFDSLNGKGLNLTAADRIKNKLFSWNATDSGRTQSWNSIIAYVGDDRLVDFFSSLMFYKVRKRVSKNQLPSEFGKQYESEAMSSYTNFMRFLEDKAEVYGKIRTGQGVKEQKLKSLFVNLSRLSVNQIYNLLFAAVIHYNIDLENPSNKEFIDFTAACQKLVVRVQVCESPVNRLDNYFSAIITAMKLGNRLSEITDQVLSLINKKIADDDTFREKFKYFAPTKPSVSEFYLRNIENYLRQKRDNRSTLQPGEATVEHIIPQTASDLKIWYGSNPIPPEIQDDPSELLIERLGNKALLYGDDNSACGNKGLEYKRTVYLEGKRGANSGTPYGTFELIKEFIDNYETTFTDKEIDERQKWMADIAVKLW